MREYVDFTLQNTDGDYVTLSEELKNNNALLMFYRGTFWPVWVNQMVQVHHMYEEVLKLNTKIYAISVDDLPKAQAMKEKTGVDFDILSDDSLKVINGYHMRDDELMDWDFIDDKVRKTIRMRFISLSSYILIDQKGYIQYQWSGHYRFRPEIDQIIDILRKIGT